MASLDNMSDTHHSTLQCVMTDITKFISRSWISSMEYNFDDYWGELELSFTVVNDVEDRQLIELRNDLLDFFNRYYPEDDISFDWQIVFKRTNKIIEVLLPEDGYRDTSDKLVDLSI